MRVRYTGGHQYGLFPLLSGDTGTLDDDDLEQEEAYVDFDSAGTWKVSLSDLEAEGTE